MVQYFKNLLLWKKIVLVGVIPLLVISILVGVLCVQGCSVVGGALWLGGWLVGMRGGGRYWVVEVLGGGDAGW